MRTSLRLALATLISLVALGAAGSADAVSPSHSRVVHCCAK